MIFPSVDRKPANRLPDLTDRHDNHFNKLKKESLYTFFKFPDKSVKKVYCRGWFHKLLQSNII